jgi:hypothetical protein
MNIIEQLDAWDGTNAIKHSVEQGKKYALPTDLLELVRPHEALRYNSQIADAIIAQTGYADKDKLETLIFLACKVFSKERIQAEDAEMTAQGWQIIPSYEHREDNIAPITYRGDAALSAKTSTDWSTSKLEIVGKIISDGAGEAFFIPKGKRSRGYYMRNLVGYYMPI